MPSRWEVSLSQDQRNFQNTGSDLSALLCNTSLLHMFTQSKTCIRSDVSIYSSKFILLNLVQHHSGRRCKCNIVMCIRPQGELSTTVCWLQQGFPSERMIKSKAVVYSIHLHPNPPHLQPDTLQANCSFLELMGLQRVDRYSRQSTSASCMVCSSVVL